MIRPKPVVLAIVSGFGVSPVIEGNALRSARLPVFSHLIETYPTVTLSADGPAVGLAEGARGSSRAGCLTIGAGRPVLDPRARIAAADAKVFANVPALRRAFDHVASSRGAVHLIGSVGDHPSDESVRILSSLLRAAEERGVPRTFVHLVFGAGEEARSARGSLVAAMDVIRGAPAAVIASVSGARFAADREHDWDRVKLAYEAMALGTPAAASAESLLDEADPAGAEIAPHGLGGERIRSGDTCVFFSLDARDVRALATALALPAFSGFPRAYIPNLRIVTLVETDPDLPVETAFPFPFIEGTLGEAVQNAGLRQLRIAETEGFVSVTDGLNGTCVVSPGEDRVIVPGQAVSRVERVPEMSSAAVADRVVKEVAHGRYDAVIMGLVAPACVAGTGDEPATVHACEAVDRAIGKVIEATLALDGVFLLTSDHGHAEGLRDPATGKAELVGTHSPVPFVVVGRAFEGLKARSGDVIGGDVSLSAPTGTLADVAPTMLKILGLPQPKGMTGQALV
jgi:2,3-bisphosphoglycerate-independent phosphoglycerate mutase